MLEEDRTSWEPWWELHKAPYLRLKDRLWATAAQTGSDEFFLGSTRRVIARDNVVPTQGDIERDVLPALKRTIDRLDQRDIVTACMVAMAKTGTDHKDFKLAQVFALRLKSHDQEVRETAALALGISGLTDTANLDLLGGLVLDDARGRAACGQAYVNDRTRAFACYALGLLGSKPGELRTKHRVATHLIEIVRSDKAVHRNVKVAATNALGMVELDSLPGRAANALRDLAVAALADFYQRASGPGDELLQAHCPPAIARLVGQGAARADAWRKRFGTDLDARGSSRRGPCITQSCALALGQMGRPVNSPSDADAASCATLLKAYRDHPDVQTRNFAIMALGEIGGTENREVLLREFSQAGKHAELPWVALALGVQAFERRQNADPDRMASDLLRRTLPDLKNPMTVGAVAIALGLCGQEEATELLRGLLRDSREDMLTGHLCIALALLGDPSANDDLREVLDRSLRRPELLRQAAVSLSVLGDREVTGRLLERLSGEVNLARLAAVAGALGFIGDRRTIARLCQLVEDESQATLSRAFAAAAVGGVVDRNRLPWNADLRGHVNYRAAVETLWNGVSGILDIL